MVKLGITLGDPSGISSEILLKGIKHLPSGIYILYGSKKILDKTAKEVNFKTNKNKNDLKSIHGLENPFVEIEDVEEAKEEGFYLINIYDKDFELGKPSLETGKASVLFLEKAVKDVLNKKIDGLTTLPISKDYIIEAGFKYKGHTDYLAEVSKTKNYMMMLLCDKMKVGLLTTHIPLKEVYKHITKDNLKNKINLLLRELKDKFKIENPKIAVVGLNPHAGDNGKIGDEEIKVINPVIEEFRRNGVNITGSLSPDTAFINYDRFDSYLAMYHDQGLIPLKLLCFKKAVNITLGLPFIRTSVDHGTGFDIAGKGIADETSFVEAVKLALRLIRLQRKNETV